MDVSKAAWRKSKRSHENGDSCIELANVPGEVVVRDSKSPDDGHITFPRIHFRHLTEAIKAL